MTYNSIFRPGLFAGQTVIVTGGGSGIGRCTAHELAALGATAVITGRTREKLEKVAAEIQEDGGKVDLEAFDIREETQVKEGVAAILDRNGPVTGLVNNAGGQFTALLKDISQKGWETVVRTNLTGGFLMSREILNQCMAEHGGSIVNITADYWGAMPLMGHSGAARAGMENFTRTAAVEWSEYGVRVNTVAPGVIASSGLETYGEAHKANLRQRRQRIPLRRLGTESEISAAVLFLLSPASAFTTGATLRVDGAAPNMKIIYQVPDHPAATAFDGFHRGLPPEYLDREE